MRILFFISLGFITANENIKKYLLFLESLKLGDGS